MARIFHPCHFYAGTDMSKKKYQRKRRQQNPLVPIGIGILLIVLAVLFMAAPKSTGNAESLSGVVPAAVNYAAPELSLTNINGKTETLADYQKSVVLVNNWATWCPPCKAEMPILSAYYNEHNVEGFTIIAIEAGDALNEVSQFAQSRNLMFHVWLDPNGKALKAFGNSNLPSSYVIDRSGTVRYAWTGEINREMLEKFVTPIIAESN
jgi:cytochrome c biogenesis protein CcmG, thiol:disulfide interchange protein DsbE